MTYTVSSGTLNASQLNSTQRDCMNPLKPNVIIWLHFEYLAPERLNLPFLISGILGGKV